MALGVLGLVVLIVDGSFGFQMETFEFLNLCQVHSAAPEQPLLRSVDHPHAQGNHVFQIANMLSISWCWSEAPVRCITACSLGGFGFSSRKRSRFPPSFVLCFRRTDFRASSASLRISTPSAMLVLFAEPKRR